MDTHELTSLGTVFGAVLAAAVSWGGAKHAISVLKEEVTENKKMLNLLQDEVKNTVNNKFCRIERQDCRETRRETHDVLVKKIDELMDRIDLQDQKRHDHSNKVQGIYGELLQKITSLETVIQERSRQYRRGDEI